MQAMLLDPYADPLWDTEPCAQLAAEQAAIKNRSLGEIFEATLKSRDHNVLMTALTGMYARLEGGWMGARVGAGRGVLIGLLVGQVKGWGCWLAVGAPYGAAACAEGLVDVPASPWCVDTCGQAWAAVETGTPG